MAGQVVLDHRNFSRHHAAFEIVDGTVVLRDLGGTNGTYVNGERLHGARHLVEGDRIDIGPSQLTLTTIPSSPLRQRSKVFASGNKNSRLLSRTSLIACESTRFILPKRTSATVIARTLSRFKAEGACAFS